MRLLSGKKLCVLLAVLVLPVFIIGVLAGPTFLSPASLFSTAGNSQDLLILRELRLPRVIMAGLIGAVLAMSGAVLQGLFRNPMADPSLIGVTAGASVGASFTILIGAQLSVFAGFSALGSLSLVALGAFLGGMLAVMLVYKISTSSVGGSSNGTSVSTMLLVGIAVMTLASALQNLMSYLADLELLRRMSLWQMGNLDLANWPRVQICLPMVLFFLVLLKGQGNNLNALLLGESEARHLGVDVDNMKKRLIFLTAMGVGIATALGGTIAFVGLIVPHLVRFISGPDHRTLILTSGLLGAILLILADVIARVILAPAELPVGIITAFLGAPFFIYLLRRQLHVA